MAVTTTIGPRFCFGEVEYEGKRLVLPWVEFHILKALIEAGDEGLTTAEIYRAVYHNGRFLATDKRTIYENLRRMRHRLKDVGVPIRIESRKKFGYRATLN